MYTKCTYKALQVIIAIVVVNVWTEVSLPPHRHRTIGGSIQRQVFQFIRCVAVELTSARICKSFIRAQEAQYCKGQTSLHLCL